MLLPPPSLFHLLAALSPSLHVALLSFLLSIPSVSCVSSVSSLPVFFLLLQLFFVPLALLSIRHSTFSGSVCRSSYLHVLFLLFVSPVSSVSPSPLSSSIPLFPLSVSPSPF